MQGWCKIKPAAAYAGVSERTMRTWLTQGLRHAKVNGCVLIKYEHIDEFIDRFLADSDKASHIIDAVLESIA